MAKTVTNVKKGSYTFTTVVRAEKGKFYASKCRTFQMKKGKFNSSSRCGYLHSAKSKAAALKKAQKSLNQVLRAMDIHK